MTGLNLQSRKTARALFLLVGLAVPVRAQQSLLRLDPARTSITFTLDAALHEVHGNFQAKPSALKLDPVSGQVSGEILVDAKSGQSGNGMRDRKMHKDVIESGNFPDIAFRPEHFSGTLSMEGKSSVRVHGIFRIHGVEREIEVPAEVEMEGSTWSAKVHLTVPYAKWGMKNPSTLFLRVSDSVEIDVAAAGSILPGNSSMPAQ